MAIDIVRHSPATFNIENRRFDLRFQPLQSSFSRPLDQISPHSSSLPGSCIPSAYSCSFLQFFPQILLRSVVLVR